MALWDAIHAALAEEIGRGTYPPGTKLPGEVALAQRFGVNRHTVRRALARLVADGRIHVRRGAGATVLPPPMDYAITKRTRFSEGVARAGRQAGRRLVRLETVPAMPGDARRLAIAVGSPVCVMESVGTADGVPVVLGAHRFAADRLPGIEAALSDRLPKDDGEAGALPGTGDASISDALAAVGVADYTRGMTRISAVSADPVSANHLMVEPGAPLIETTGLDLGPDGAPINDVRTLMVAGRMTLVVDGGGVMSTEDRASEETTT
ncbi:MAG: GntR family transcriptional regulator [Pseudomonadota bacterium]